MKTGIVIKSTGSWHNVSVNGELYECRIKGKFRIQGIKTTNPIAVGDKVDFEILEDKTGLIKKIHPRKNYIIRKSVNLSKQAHIIAANIDQALLLVTVTKPKTLIGFIDRFLITAEAYNIPATLVFNKIDILSSEEKKELEFLIKTYSSIGYNCIEISALQGTNVELIKNLLKDKTTVISGHSGTGKSTLINQIDANINLKTGDISQYHEQGKHTTTFTEMHPLQMGGFIIDTPGIRGLGLIDIEKHELSHFFPEMKALMQNCKFNNCVHINEPNCAVKNAVALDQIPEVRYQSYWNIYHDKEETHYRKDIYS